MNFLEPIRDIIQEDIGDRGLRKHPELNLINACPGDFELACRSLATAKRPVVGIVTGFFIAHGQPPACETDGPLGALYLARALVPIGFTIVLLTDAMCRQPLIEGLRAARLEREVSIVVLPPYLDICDHAELMKWRRILDEHQFTHLIALERVGPSHTPGSISNQAFTSAEKVEMFRREVPEDQFNRCHSMRGRDITASTAPAHILFDYADEWCPTMVTIGIGDGGNEIGMGKISWNVIRENIPNGGLVACRVATDHLIVCGISNWGAYGLAAGIHHLRRVPIMPELFDVDRERAQLRVMIDKGPLVDGVTGMPTVSVDGIPFDRYVQPLEKIKDVLTRT